MKVIEQFIRSKTYRPSECEDSIFVPDNFAAVIDGVTSKSNREYNRESSGKRARNFLEMHLKTSHSNLQHIRR